MASAYCSGLACVTRKADGEPCATADECTSGVCGGRCCAAGCTCTLPSAANLLKDPGFDSGVGNWTTMTVTGSPSSITRSTRDAESCPYSGSLQASAADEQVISQCVRNSSLVGDFNFGTRFAYDSNGSPPNVICQANFHSGFNCDGDPVLANETGAPVPAGNWRSIAGSVAGVSGANSVDLTCYLFGGAGVTVYLDMSYISKAPAAY